MSSQTSLIQNEILRRRQRRPSGTSGVLEKAKAQLPKFRMFDKSKHDGSYAFGLSRVLGLGLLDSCASSLDASQHSRHLRAALANGSVGAMWRNLI